MLTRSTCRRGNTDRGNTSGDVWSIRHVRRRYHETVFRFFFVGRTQDEHANYHKKVFCFSPGAPFADTIRRVPYGVSADKTVGIHYIIFLNVLFLSAVVPFLRITMYICIFSFLLKFSVKVHHFLHSSIDIYTRTFSLCGEYDLLPLITVIHINPVGRGLLCLRPLILCARVTCVFFRPRPVCYYYYRGPGGSRPDANTM